MSLDADLAAWLRLSLTPGMRGETMRRLLRAYGDPQQVLAASRAELAAHVASPLAAALKTSDFATELSAVEGWLKDPANAVLTLGDPRYPPQLLQIPDPPPLLYVKGRA